MSAYTTIARPYAKAAFEYAVEHHELDSWSAFLQRAALIVADKRVMSLLFNPKLSTEEKLQFIKDVCDKEITDKQINFLESLGHFQRLITIPDIALLFNELCKERDKSIEVDVLTAFPMNEKQQQRLKKVLKIRLQKAISLNINIDKSLIGGAIIRAGDFVIDGSSRGQLQRMRNILEA